jgi:hypothetical protein
MGIPETQLESWEGQGAITTSATTYATIKSALEASTTGYASKDYKIFLQGSYGNDTNIYKESDVDVVIRLDSTFYKDLSRLSETEQACYAAAGFTAAEYPYASFKKDVVAALSKSFQSDVKPGTKAINILPKGNRRSADVITACQFRRYKKFLSLSNQEYEEGICFWASDGTQIENYPKQHSANCTTKHQNTSNMFKPVVRIFKNMRTRLVEDGTIDSALAPSYYLEGLLYNVPNPEFEKSTYQAAVLACLNWFHAADAAARNNWVCANNQYFLLRGPAAVTWGATKCDTFIKAVIKMWNGW